MGSSHSTVKTCPYCGSGSDYFKKDNKVSCSRCGGLIPPKHPEQASHRGGFTPLDQHPEDKTPLHCLHIVPILDTLPNQTSLPEDVLFNNYLKPYLSEHKGTSLVQGSNITINQTLFHILTVSPPSGVLSSQTMVYSNFKPPSSSVQIQRIHLLPTQASLDAHPDSNVNNILREYFLNNQRLVIQGEMLFVSGVQFKVMACDPDSGVVVSNTILHTEGAPLLDLDRTHILPIIDTMNLHDRDMNPDNLFHKFLQPYFRGTNRFLKRGERIDIFGTIFKVIECSPSEGLVTLNTVLHCDGEKLTEAELKRQQEEEDRQLAMRMQSEISMPARDEPYALQMRLADSLRAMPPNHPNRILYQRLHDSLWIINNMPYDRTRVILGFENLLRAASQLQGDHGGNTGAAQNEIDTLPTYTYQKREKDDVKERIQCMICLGEFEDGEELRTLPCLHRYHKQCIDEWLSRNKQCPVLYLL